MKNKEFKNELKEEKVDLVYEEQEFQQIRKDLSRIASLFKQIGFRDFVNYLSSPWRIMWINFWAGIFRGLGILIGMTLVIGILIWFLTKLVDFPLIGIFFQQILGYLESVDVLNLNPQNGIVP